MYGAHFKQQMPLIINKPTLQIFPFLNTEILVLKEKAEILISNW